MNATVQLLVAPKGPDRAPLPPEHTTVLRWEIALPTDLVIAPRTPTLIPIGWGLRMADALTEGRLMLHGEVSDRLDLVNRPCGTIDADYVDQPVGIIVRTKRDQPVVLRAGTMIGSLELHRIAPTPGSDGSPVMASKGTLVRATPLSACADFMTTTPSDIVMQQDGLYIVPTDLVLDVEHRFYASIRSRSGLALKHGVSLIAPCPIQTARYKAISVALTELTFQKRGGAALTITPGMRIAQIGAAELGDTILPMEIAQRDHLEPLPEMAGAGGARTGGFGHTHH